jgi:hypothetical protein
MARELAGDFLWDIQSEDGFPSIAINDANENSEVIFKYNFTGNLTESKYLDVKLYQNDCITVADTSLAFTNTTTGDELDIELDIIQESITSSDHYTDIDAGAAAIIGFCLRVDYNYVDAGGNIESINFYETNVTITVDLTANFTLATISAERTLASSADADIKLDYDVKAFMCLDDNSVVSPAPVLVQGSFLQVCVSIDSSTVTTDNIVVEDILYFFISQTNSTGTNSTPITGTVADPLTDKVCRENGICNVKTQLLSKFFTETVPDDLKIEGVAILAFGQASLMPSTTPVRRLRAPIRGLLTSDDVEAFMAAQQNMNRDESESESESGLSSVVSVVADSSQRMLQEGAAESQSDFGLLVGLQGINGESDEDEDEDEDSSSGGVSTIAVAAIVLVVLAVGCGFGFIYSTRRNRKEDPKDIVDYDSSGTSPSQASVYSPSSSQHVSHRGARDQPKQID